jgi:hypothetical protein
VLLTFVQFLSCRFWLIFVRPRMWKLARFATANLSRSRRFSTAIPGPCIVHKRGADILHDPWFNKVKAFCFLNLFVNQRVYFFAYFPVFVINSSMTVGEFVYLKFCAFIVFFIAFKSES